MAQTLILSAEPLPSRRNRRRNAAVLALVAVGHLLALLVMRSASGPAPTPAPAPDLVVALAPPEPVPPAAKPRAHRAGGAPATAPQRARPSTPEPRPALQPPMTLRPPPPVVVPLPRPPAQILAPQGPELSAPTSGAGLGAATGGEGAGTGTGAGGAGAPTLADPDWIAFPAIDVISAHYPLRAAERGEKGSVILSCRGDVEGRARNCRVASESPRGAGFGRAALELSGYFRFRPLRVDGRAVEATLEIPIDFSIDAPPPPA